MPGAWSRAIQDEKTGLSLHTLVTAVTLVTAALAAWLLLPVEEYILGFASWMSGLGPVGIALYLLIYIGFALALGPAWALSVAAGVAFGLWALFLVLPTALTAAVAGFLVARHLARDRVAPLIHRRARLKAVDLAIQEHGVKVVLLVRLSPLLPFGAKSYLFGLSRVSLWRYLIGTAAGILPGSILYVFFGAAGRIAASGPQNAAEWLLLTLGLAATAGVVWLIQREAAKKLREMGVA